MDTFDGTLLTWMILFYIPQHFTGGTINIPLVTEGTGDLYRLSILPIIQQIDDGTCTLNSSLLKHSLWIVKHSHFRCRD